MGALGGCLTLSCIPCAMIIGILGIVLDRSKLLAVCMTCIAGILVLFFVTCQILC